VVATTGVAIKTAGVAIKTDVVKVTVLKNISSIVLTSAFNKINYKYIFFDNIYFDIKIRNTSSDFPNVIYLL